MVVGYEREKESGGGGGGHGSSSSKHSQTYSSSKFIKNTFIFIFLPPRHLGL